MKTLENLLLDELAEMYQAEQELAKALSNMTKLATDLNLREALQVHAYETVGHISKVAQVFECFGEPTRGSKGHAISGLLAEAAALVAQHEESSASDAAIISAVQKLEHFEIATYGCLRDWAMVLNNREAAILLEEILEEEKSGDHKLSDAAQAINVDALRQGDWYGSEMGSENMEAMARYDRRHGKRHHHASM